MSDEFKVYAAEQYALHIRSMRHRVNAAQLDIDDMRESVCGVSGVQYTDMPGSPNTYGDAIPDGVAKLLEMIDDYVTQLVEWMDERYEACRCFAKLDSKSYELLTYYYANGMTWEQTAERMGYTSEHVQRNLKPVALSMLYGVMPEQWRRNIPKAI